jgi:YD repeat-containing protein
MEPDDGVLLFSDVSANTIYQVGADDEITEFREPTRYTNGLAVDPQGRLIAAESASRRVTRTERDGSVVPIAERFEGARLNQPNDITVRSDGTIYFTDPAFGDAAAQAELDFRGVFRIAPDGRLTAEYRGETSETPNGLALSPDESLLYVTDYAAGLVRVSTSLPTALFRKPGRSQTSRVQTAWRSTRMATCSSHPMTAAPSRSSLPMANSGASSTCQPARPTARSVGLTAAPCTSRRGLP